MKTATLPKSTRGFSLLEMLVTLSVAVLLLTIGIPSFRSVTMNSRLVAQANEFVASVQLARSAAVRYQRNATICLSSNYSAALPTCAAGTNWSTGWIVWVDQNRNSTPDAGEILAVHEPVVSSSTLTGSATNRFDFDPRGMALSVAGSVTLCDNRTGETGRVVKVNSAGRTNVSEAVCS